MINFQLTFLENLPLYVVISRNQVYLNMIRKNANDFHFTKSNEEKQ